MNIGMYGLYVGVPITLITFGLFLAFMMAQSKYHEIASTKCQACKLSDSVDKEYYLCDKPVSGKIDVMGKRGTPNYKKKIATITTISQPHQGAYPPKMWARLQSSIPEYYVDESFIPVTLKKTDPLEAASALARLTSEHVTETVVHEANERKEEAKKVASGGGTKSLIYIVMGIMIVGIIINIYFGYSGMKTAKAITDIQTGLKSLGILP